MIIVKDFEGSETPFYFLGNELACHSSMNAVPYSCSSGTEIKDFLAHGNSNSQSNSIFLCWFFKLHLPQNNANRAR